MHPPDRLGVSLTYSWEPFTFRGRHLTFADHRVTRLSAHDCSHWGAVVYKWEGLIAEGDHAGEMGILIGESQDLRQRIKQYVSGTQKSGNKFWREQFLTKGNIHLYILKFDQIEVPVTFGESLTLTSDAVASNNVRLVLEQLLVLREVIREDRKRWVVNRKL